MHTIRQARKERGKYRTKRIQQQARREGEKPSTAGVFGVLRKQKRPFKRGARWAASPLLERSFSLLEGPDSPDKMCPRCKLVSAPRKYGLFGHSALKMSRPECPG